SPAPPGVPSRRARQSAYQQGQASAGRPATLVEGASHDQSCQFALAALTRARAVHPAVREEEDSMTFVDCSACADRYRRPWVGIVLAIVLCPLFWAWAALAALGRLFQPCPRQPGLCLLTGSRPLRRDVARTL